MTPSAHETSGGAPPPVGDLASARDRALVRRLGQHGTRAADALTTLFHAYAPVAFTLARRITRQDQLAEDVVQEAFLGLWKSPESYDSRKGTVRAYLLTAVHHRAVDAVRREQTQRRRQEAEMTAEPVQDVRDVAEEISEHDEAAQRRRLVTTALAHLPGELTRVTGQGRRGWV